MLSIILLGTFLTGMVLIGFWGMKKTSSLNDFFLGGRTIGPWISAFAYGTTYFSAVVFIGFAGKIGWGFGLNGLWIAAGNVIIGSTLAWLVLGKRTRRMTQNLDVMTMPEFLNERFQGRYIKMITATIIFVFLLPYSASVFKGLGHLFETSFGISYDVALLIMIAITGLYLVMGGYFAITLTDFIQGMIMLVGCVIMIIMLVNKGGGFSVILSNIDTNYWTHMPRGHRPDILLLAGLVFMTSFGAWGMPQMVQKFYAIKDERAIKRGAIVTTVFATVVVFTAYFNGALTHVFYDVVPAVNGKAAFDRMIPDLLKTNLSEGFLAVILLLVLSASMSTLSSLVLVSSSSIAIDLYKGHVNPSVSKENSLAMMRFLSALFVVISYFIARYELAFIVTLMSLSWGAVAGAFMAPYLYGLFWKGATRIAVGVGMITGLVTSITLFYVMGPGKAPIASSIAMIVPFVVIPLISAFTAKPDEELINKAFEGING